MADLHSISLSLLLLLSLILGRIADSIVPLSAYVLVPTSVAPAKNGV